MSQASNDAVRLTGVFALISAAQKWAALHSQRPEYKTNPGEEVLSADAALLRAVRHLENLHSP